MLRIALGPTSQKTVTQELMPQCAALARRHPGVRLHTHLAENQVRGLEAEADAPAHYCRTGRGWE
jgi:cytosine/adenosine deaminase-related metal-dependent hydrolase